MTAKRARERRRDRRPKPTWKWVCVDTADGHFEWSAPHTVSGDTYIVRANEDYTPLEVRRRVVTPTYTAESFDAYGSTR